MRAAIALLLAAGLAGCSSVPFSPSPDTDRPALAPELQHLDSWEVHARLALRAGEHSAQAGLQWTRAGARHTIVLRGPFGQGLARLTRDADGAHLQDVEHNQHEAESAEALLLKTTGWRIPVDELDYWIRGLPAPGVSHEPAPDETGRLAALRQSGWEIRFSDYRRYGRYELPGFLVLRISSGAAGDEGLETRLVIDRWVFAP